MYLVMSGVKTKQTWFKDVIFYDEYVWENVKNPRKIIRSNSHFWPRKMLYAAAAAESLQSCSTLCDPIDGSPPGSTVPGILHARTLEWVAISFSNTGKWKVEVKSLSRVRLLATPWTAAHQALPSMDFPGKSTGVGCKMLYKSIQMLKNVHIVITVSTWKLSVWHRCCC